MHDPPGKASKTALIVVLLLSSSMAYYHLGVFLPHFIGLRAARGLVGQYSFGDDFYPIWLTSRAALLDHRNPYSSEMTREIQTGIFGHSLIPRRPGDPLANYRAFAYPAYVDLLFWPFSLLPFTTVRVLLAVTFAILTIASIPLWFHFLRLTPGPSLILITVMLTLSSYAVLEGLSAGQLGLAVGFLLAAACAALIHDRLFLAGSFLAFTFIKPQMTIVVAAYLLVWSLSSWRRRRNFVVGLIVWSTLLVIASVLVWPHWIGEWVHVLSGYGGYSTPPLITYSLGSSLGPKLGPALTIILLLAAAMLIWKMRDAPASSPRFSLTVSLLLALTAITILPGQAVHDHVMLLPGIFLIGLTWRRWSATSAALRVIVAAGGFALFWQWIIGPPLLLIRFLAPSARLFNDELLLLPFHAAASIPLAVSAILGYVMVIVLRKRRSEPLDGVASATSPELF
jgi:glycosyl transferase family 87